MTDIGRSLEPLLTCGDPFVGVEGQRGTGKTFGILTIILQRAFASPGSRWLLCRSTRTRLTDTVLVTLEQLVFPSLGMDVPGGAGRENRHEYRLPKCDSVLVTMGLDDIARGQSAEFAGIYLAEATEMSRLEDVIALAGTLRQKGVAYPHQCIVDCNPTFPSHWLNQKLEDAPAGIRQVKSREDYDRLQQYNHTPAKDPLRRWKRIITRHQDNPAYWDHEAWDWRPIGRKYVIDTLGSLSGHLRTRWLDGEWAAAEGVVFPEFSDRHVITPFDIPESWPVYAGVDPGYDHPCAILWFAIAPNGVHFVIDELYRGGKSVAEHAADMKIRSAGRNMRGVYGDPQHCFSRTAQSPVTIAQQFGQQGIKMMGWNRSQDKQAMVENVREMLRSDRIRVFSTCPATIGEMQSWAFKRNARGEQLSGDDQYEDRNNHAMDVVCGLCDLHLEPKPSPIRIYGGANLPGVKPRMKSKDPWADKITLSQNRG